MDSGACEKLYEACYMRVFSYVMTLAGDRHLAEELTQETFCQAIRTVGSYDGRCKMSTWLCGIAKNVLRTHLRKHPPAEPIDELPLSVPSAEAEAVSGEERLQLLRRLHALPEPSREVVYLRVFGDLSFREIGEVLERSENWARVTFYRAKEKLKENE